MHLHLWVRVRVGVEVKVEFEVRVGVRMWMSVPDHLRISTIPDPTEVKNLKRHRHTVSKYAPLSQNVAL